MYNLIWKLFLETGNIETYLLLKQIENEAPQSSKREFADEGMASIDMKH